VSPREVLVPAPFFADLILIGTVKNSGGTARVFAALLSAAPAAAEDFCGKPVVAG
jgi:hypothetical protein